MLNICYYVSGHGFGHATRASQVIHALLQNPSTRVTVCTKAPQHLFPHARLTYREREVDSIVIQPLPYEIDVEATFQELESFIQKLQNKNDAGKTWIEEETEFVDQGNFDALLADAPWSIGLLQPKRKLTKILVSNFTFDLIFHDLSTKHLPSSSSPQTQAKYTKDCSEVINGYTSFDYLIRLPGFIDYPFLSQPACKTRIIDTPLVYRPPTQKSREEILRELNIPLEFRNHKILLVQFGGHAVSASSSPPELPPNWICLINTTTSTSDPRFFSFSNSIYLPDLLNISSAVLGKIGYGTVSECVGMGKPLIYVRREMFAEEGFLLRYLEKESVCEEIGKEEFERGEWSGVMEKVTERYESLVGNGRKFGYEDGSLEAARIVEGCVETCSKKC